MKRQARPGVVSLYLSASCFYCKADPCLCRGARAALEEGGWGHQQAERIENVIFCYKVPSHFLSNLVDIPYCISSSFPKSSFLLTRKT